MKIDRCHIQYHPGSDCVFVTHLPSEQAPAHARALAIDRDGEFFYALYAWARQTAVIPPALAWLRAKIPAFRPKVKTVKRTWVHPEGLIKIEVTVTELLAAPVVPEEEE